MEGGEPESISIVERLTFCDCDRGPGFRISDFESNRIIGDAQFRGAQRIMNGPLSPVSGAVRSVHVYVEM